MQTPEVFVYLGADRFVPAGNLLNGAAVPGKDGKFKMAELAAAVLAAAFADLQASGAIALRVVEKKVLFVKSQTVCVDATGAAPEGGFGHALHAIASRAPGRSVNDIFREWLTQDISNPWSWVLMGAFGEAEAQGLIVRDGGTGNKIAGLFGAIPKASIAPDKRAEVDAGIAAAAAAWEAFKAADAALAAQLLKACAGALSSRKETSTTDSADF